jgi:hypothetical protein
VHVVRRDFERRRVSTRTLLLLALEASVFAQIMFVTAKYFYETALVLPAILLAATLALGGIAHRIPRLAKEGAIAAVFSLSVLSQLELLREADIWRGLWTRPGMLPGWSSLSVFGYGTQRERIVTLARRCGIDPEQHPAHVFVDEQALFPFWRSSQLMVYPFAFNEGAGRRIEPLLTRYAPARLIAECTRLPAELRARATASEGGFCCIGPGLGP